jgi:hypothetical protein
MHNKPKQNKEFAHIARIPKSINELLGTGGARLGALRARALDRRVALEHVRAALPPQLAATVVSAGVLDGTLTISVAGASWAARLRYVTDSLKLRVGQSLAADIHRVRIKVTPARG